MVRLSLGLDVTCGYVDRNGLKRRMSSEASSDYGMVDHVQVPNWLVESHWEHRISLSTSDEELDWRLDL